MILNQKELHDVVDADTYGDYYVPLTVRNIQQFKGGLRIEGSSFNYEVSTTPRNVNDEWKLSEGVYHVYFNERLNGLSDDGVGFIMPSPNALTVGVEASNRMVRNGQLRTLLNVNKSIDIEEDSVIAVLMVYRNQPALSHEDVESIVREQVSKQVVDTHDEE